LLKSIHRPISRYRRHYGSKVNRSKKRKQDVIAFVNTVTQFVHRGSYAHIVYDMYPVDLENNERSCEYSAIQYVAILL
jgi:hypothetical protein